MDCGDSDKRDVRRPMNAFLIFCKRHRSIVREKNPDLDNRSVTRILGDLWANLKEDEKSMYTDLAKQYKDAFMKANPDYKWHNPEKTVVPQKPTMPKPTNMKVLKNEIDLFSAGSIIPGKLADPSNMGGLSLLLIAGQQSDQQNFSSDSLNVGRATETQNEVTKTSQKQNPSSSNGETVEPRSEGEKEKKMAPVKVTNRYPFNDTNFTSKECSDQETERSDVKNDPENENNPSLLDLAEMCSNQMEDKTNPEKNFGIKTSKSLLKEAILDIKHDTRHVVHKELDMKIETTDADARPDCNEKENISNQTVEDTKEKKDMEEEESAMITCGKLVVNHIIDKLYSSEIVTAARNLTQPLKGPVDNMATSIKIEDNGVDNSGNSDMTKQEDNIPEVIKADNKSMDYDEPDGLKDKEVLVKKDSDESSSVIEKDASDSESVVDKQVLQDNNTETSKRKYLLSETGSTEGEDMEESQPVRKSRRRNRGQRYQELINEGIIQPSKERMAALQQPNPKDEMAEEDFQSIDSYILPETAIRRIRKRTTSESAKDKLYPSDDAKRYKTGDFDLEAHIATLPACPIESMGRKRGFLRSRHCSETTHIRKQLSEDSQLLPVFDADKTVSLPPHVRLPSPQRNTEPVVGSRKRKARKHSITHLIPVPQSLLNGKQSQPISAWPASEQLSNTCTNSEKQVQFESCPSQEEKCESASEISDIAVKRDMEFDGKMNAEQIKSENCDNMKQLPRTVFGCDREQRTDCGVEVKEDDKDFGAIDKNETLVSQGETVPHKHETFKSDSQVHVLLDSGIFGVGKEKGSVENCKTVLKETLILNKDPGLADKVSFGKPSERSCKSLQEVDSNIPRGGSDVIPQIEVEEITKLQDSLEKKVPDSEIPETDLNFNSTVHSA